MEKLPSSILLFMWATELSLAKNRSTTYLNAWVCAQTNYTLHWKQQWHGCTLQVVGLAYFLLQKKANRPEKICCESLHTHTNSHFLLSVEDTKTLSPTCIFSTLNVADKPYVFNYLDGYKENGKEYKKGKEEKMEERIREKYNKCSLYSAVGNNCEHLATYVRYGEKISLQVRVTDSTVDNISPFAANIHNSVTHFIRSP